MRVHREIEREIGCLTLRAMFDVGYVLRAFRVGLAEGLAGQYLFSGKMVGAAGFAVPVTNH
jgi:hypothetical protein